MIVKMIGYFVVAVLFCGLFYMGWKLTSRNAYETAEYSVVEVAGEFEIRDYPELILVTTSMDARGAGGNGSFVRLFRYISGDNEGEQKVAMTTPVFVEPETDQASGQMGFVIPKNVVDSKVPTPANQRVQLTVRPKGRFAVMRFPGRLDEETMQQKKSELESWVAERGYNPIGAAETASYDPPWTPGLMRRNEIVIRISED